MESRNGARRWARRIPRRLRPGPYAKSWAKAFNSIARTVRTRRTLLLTRLVTSFPGRSWFELIECAAKGGSRRRGTRPYDRTERLGGDTFQACPLRPENMGRSGRYTFNCKEPAGRRRYEFRMCLPSL